MPQKKNPDVAELARGKTGRIYGNLMSIITTMKGLPLAYNRDMQEDKQGLFDTLDTLHSTLEIFAEMLKTIKVNTRRVREAIKDYILATDLADYLVKKGMPFREAYSVVAKLSEYAINAEKSFHELSLSEYRNFSPLFAKDVYNITLESSIISRDIPGGTAPNQVEVALKKARKLSRIESSQEKKREK